MATPHIRAEKGDIAEKILLPGDPLRAKFISENFLQNSVQFNDIRNMLGFTGIYKGEKVSVMGTGMGVSSIGIYSYELIKFFDVKKLIRVGTCGSYKKDVGLHDIILAQGHLQIQTFKVSMNWMEHTLPFQALTYLKEQQIF